MMERKERVAPVFLAIRGLKGAEEGTGNIVQAKLVNQAPVLSQIFVLYDEVKACKSHRENRSTQQVGKGRHKYFSFLVC